MSFLTSDYGYDLPSELIAQRPAEPRDSSRLMVIDRKKGSFEHHRFSDLPNWIQPEQVIVANQSKVMRARLLGYRLISQGEHEERGGQIEFLLLEELEPLVWEGMFKSSAKQLPGFRFEIPSLKGEALRGELIRGPKESKSGTVVARFERDPLKAGVGKVPLPPYIERNRASELTLDAERYQTIYAEEEGSAAAPTAGLHFTPQVMDQIQKKGAFWSPVTLHVGLGTFRPVKVQDIREHEMHAEYYRLSEETADRVNQARKSHRPVLAIGTTAVRTLESSWSEAKQSVQAGAGSTSIFIYPGVRFNVVDQLLTNFHLPHSTLLMLVSAFAGQDLIREAYRVAVQEKYRFFSYGDAMLIL